MVVSEGEKFFTQEVVLLLGPFRLEELDDGKMPGEEAGPVPPDGILGIRCYDLVRIAKGAVSTCAKLYEETRSDRVFHRA